MIYEFGLYKLDADRLELWRGDHPVAVEPQVFSLLLCLIENREHVVSKDQLIEQVWNSRIVCDATLSSRINAARHAVGDDGKAQAVIRTISRRGFRFVTEVSENAAAHGTASELMRTGAAPATWRTARRQTDAGRPAISQHQPRRRAGLLRRRRHGGFNNGAIKYSLVIRDCPQLELLLQGRFTGSGRGGE